MKKLLVMALLCLACGWANAQINVSTGTNGSGAALPLGSTDPLWTIVNSPYPPGTYPAYVVPSYSGFWQPTPVAGSNAGWINKAVTVSTELPGIYTFERSFSVPLAATGFNYSLSVAYDDVFVSLELVSPALVATPITVAVPGTPYFLNTPSTGAITGTGTWRIRAKVQYIDQLGAFMLAGTIKIVADSSVYCCTGPNLVRNGNFEAGNTAFASQYVFQPAVAANSVLPGRYNVVNRPQSLAISPQWNVEDHTKCINGSNARFMVVNGRTTQPVGTTRIIWQQLIPVINGRQYKLCANFKNMPQCSFDVQPQVRFEINGVFGPWTTINTAAGMCNWQLLYQCFQANGQAANIRIHLKEDGLGDGNDVAIDDIAVQEKLSQNLNFTVQHQGNPKVVTASVNTLSPADDQLLTTECQLKDRYYWFVYEVSGFPSLSIVPNSFAWSSNNGGFNSQLPGSTITPGWALTTTFPGYAFSSNKLYVVGLYVPSCCESCYADGFTYQLTGSFGARQQGNTPIPQMTESQKEEIKARFIEGQFTPQEVTADNSVVLYPNPATDQVSIRTDKAIKLVQVISADGMVKLEAKGSPQTMLHIIGLASGVYMVKISFSNGETVSEKLIKE